ncbi:MAG: hypothetical protein WBA17_00465 [Saprospiraceae bacterium]
MDYIYLLIEFLFLALGIYVYLFSRGKINFRDGPARERAEEFRRENAGWMRILGLALAAIMLVNIVVHIVDLAGGGISN